MEYGLIGCPLGHSHSPFVHRQFGYDYDLRVVEKEDLGAFLTEGDYLGLNVTIPHKTAVIPYLDELDESAKRCGAVNTIVVRDGKKIGYNTDIFGMEYALIAAKIPLNGKNVLILGTGGTSKMAQELCFTQGARSVTVVSRSGQVDYETVYEKKDAEIILNCTPVGMYPHNGERAIDLKRFPNLCGVFDAVYNPLKTALLLDAEELGIPCSDGLKMLVAQAKRAAEIFRNEEYPDEMIDKVERRLFHKVANVVLIGMPGCGKTTVGKKIAEIMQREFFDVDAEIVKSENRSIERIFQEDGEGYFRAVEKRVLADLSKRQGIVLSTGGGAVIDPDNIRNMRQNGILIRINRNLNNLSCDGRPLSKDRAALEKIAAEREKYYRLADASFENDMPTSCAKKIVEYFQKQ